MSSADSLKIAKLFLEKLGSGAAPEQVATLFSENLDWAIPGDAGVLPWVGHRSGRSAVSEFVRDSRLLIERSRFAVQDILANDTRAVILGELSARKDSCLKELAGGGPVQIVACYPRAVRWLFSAGDAPLPTEGVEILNMRTETADAIVGAVLGGAGAEEKS